MNSRTLDVLLRLRGTSSEALGAINSVYQALQSLGALAQSLTGSFAGIGAAMQSNLVAPARTSASVLQQTFVGAQQASGGFLSSLVGIGRSAFFIAPLVSAVGNIAKGFLASSIQLETFTSQYVTFLGSLDAANARLKELQEINIKSPFELPDLVQADILLQATGQRTRDLVVNVSNAAAALGGTQEKLRDISFAVSRIASQDFGFGFMRLRELAVANRQELEGKGLKFDRNNTYLGTAEQAMTAINALIVEKFGGAAERAAETWQGVMSNIADRFGILQTILAQGVFDELKKELVGFLMVINDPRVEQFAGMIGVALGGAIRLTINAVRGLASAISSVLLPALSYINSQLGGTISFFGMLYAAIEPLGQLVVAVFTGDFGSAFQILQTIVGNLGALILNGLLNLGADLYRGGQNIIAAFADGIISGAVSAVTAAVTFVANIVSSFLRGFSPPKEGPLSTIDKWFPNVLNAYLGSWKEADWGVLTDITNEIADSFETLVKEGKIKGKEAISLVVGTTGKTGLNQLVTTGLNEIVQAGRVTAQTWGAISRTLVGVNDELLNKLELKFREAALAGEVTKLEAQLAKITDNDAKQALSDALDKAKKAVGEARTSAQQKAAKEQVRLIEQEQKRRDTVAKQLQTQIDLINTQLAANKSQQAGVEAMVKLREREMQFMKAITESMQKSGGGGGAADQSDKDAEAAWRYSYAIADNATKLQMLRDKLGGVKEGSAEYYDILLDIHNLEGQMNEDAQNQAQARADAAWEYSYALADNETKLQMLRDKGKDLEEGSVEYYDNLLKQNQLQGQMADEAAQAAKKAEDDAKRRSDAEFDYQMKLADTAGKLALLRGKLEGLEPGSVEYYQTLGEINDLEQQLAKEAEKRGKAGGAAGTAGAGGLNKMADAAAGLGGGLTQIQQALEDGRKKWRDIGNEFGKGRDRILGVRDAVKETIDRIMKAEGPLGKVVGFVTNMAGRIKVFFDNLKPAFDLFSKFSTINPFKNFKTPDMFKNGVELPVEDIVEHSLKAVTKIEWIQFGKALLAGVKRGWIAAFGDIDFKAEIRLLIYKLSSGIKEEWSQIKWAEIWASITNSINGLAADIGAAIAKVDWAGMWDTAVAKVRGVADKIKAALNPTLMALAIREFFIGGLEGLGTINFKTDTFMQVATKIVRGVWNALEVVSFAPLILAFFTRFGGAFASAAPMLAGAVGSIGGVLQKSIGGLIKIVPKVGSILGPLAAGFGTFLNTLASGMTRVYPIIFGAWAGVMSFVDDLIIFFGPKLAQLGKLFAPITAVLSKAFGKLTPIVSKIAPVFGKLVPILGSLLPSLSSLLTPILAIFGPLGLLAAAVVGLQTAGIDLLPVINRVGEFIGNALNKGLQLAFVAVVKFVPQVLTYLGQNVPRIFQIMQQWTVALGSWVLNALPKIFGLLNILVGQLLTWVTTYGPTIATAFGEWAASLGNFVLEALPIVITNLTGLVNTLVTWIGENGATWIAGLGGWVIALAQWVVDAIPSLLNGLSSLIGTAINFIVTALPEWINALAKWGFQAFEWIVQAAPTLIANLGTFLQQVIQFIIDGVPALASNLLKWGLEFIGWILPRIPDILLGLGKVILAILEWVARVAVDIAVGLIEWGAKFILWIADLLIVLPGKLGEIWDQVMTWLGETAPKIAEKIKEWSLAFFSWIATVLADLGAKFSEISTAVRTKIGDLGKEAFNWFKDIGKEMINGLVKGVEGLGEALYNATVGPVMGVVGAIADKLGIESPSTVMRDLIGKNMVAGVVVGVEQESPTLTNAVDTLFNSLIGKAQGTNDPFVSAVVGSVNNALTGMQPVLSQMVSDSGLSFEEMRKRAETAMEAARLGVETATGAMAGVGQTNADLLGTNLAAGTDEGRMKLLQIMMDLQQQFTYIADKYGREGTAIGDAIGSGMVRGLADKADQLARTAADTAYRATVAAKAALGIASPSKVFYGIGLDTVAGMANALNDMGYAVSDAMTNVLDPVVEAGYGLAKPLSDGFGYAAQQAAMSMQAGLNNMNGNITSPLQNMLLGTSAQLLQSPLQRQLAIQSAGLMGNPLGSGVVNITYAPNIYMNPGATMEDVQALLEQDRLNTIRQLNTLFNQ